MFAVSAAGLWNVPIFLATVVAVGDRFNRRAKENEDEVRLPFSVAQPVLMFELARSLQAPFSTVRA